VLKSQNIAVVEKTTTKLKRDFPLSFILWVVLEKIMPFVSYYYIINPTVFQEF